MARTFNGSSDKLSIATPLVTATPLTLSAWAKTASGDLQTVLSCEGLYPGNYSNGWFLGIYNYAVWAYTASGAAQNGSFAASTATISSGVWGHCAAVFAAANDRRAYLNGANKGTEATSRAVDSSYVSNTKIGVRGSADIQFMNGSIAEAAAWNVALTDDEVAILAKGYSPLTVRPASLIAYWPLIGKYSTEISLKSGFGLAITGTTVADHPRVFYPGL